MADRGARIGGRHRLLPCRREVAGMKAGAGAQLLALAVEVDLPELLLQRIALVGGVVDDVCLGSHTVDLAHLEVAAGELPFQAGRGGVRVLLVEGVEIEMVVAVGPVGEDDVPSSTQTS